MTYQEFPDTLYDVHIRGKYSDNKVYDSHVLAVSLRQSFRHRRDMLKYAKSYLKSATVKIAEYKLSKIREPEMPKL